MKWAKLHGLGNDFLIARAADAADTGQPQGALAQRVCRRHTGMGADGVLYFEPSVGDPEADVAARIYNADGSEAEMSGNGTRCLAAYLTLIGNDQSATLRIRTVAGIRVFRLKDHNDRAWTFESSMGRPVTDPALVPVHLGDGSGPLIDYPLDAGPEVIPVTICSMGNPHCSTFWPEIDVVPVDTLGPLLEHHAAFPQRTNVEFIQMLDRHHLRVRFWERGVGPTLASGTGGSAAAVAAILSHRADSPVVVEVERGSLRVYWQAPGELLLTGPAEYICSCEIP
jgi:diaminopimelate epimerase